MPSPTGELKTHLPPLPLEFLRERDILADFIRRVNTFGERNVNVTKIALFSAVMRYELLLEHYTQSAAATRVWNSLSADLRKAKM